MGHVELATAWVAPLVLLLAPACIVGVFELARLVLFFWRRAVGRAGLHG